MKKIRLWLLLTTMIMIALPWLSVTFVKGDHGMAVCFILFYVLNPLYVIVSSIYAGKDMKELWMLPLMIALLFLLGTWMFFDHGEMAFVFYAVVYFVLGMLSMLISWIVKNM